MKSSELLIILKEERKMYFDALEGCDEPEFSHYGNIQDILDTLIEQIEAMHKDCGS